MAATLMSSRGPEQELFAHLRSFESYQSRKSPPTTPKNIPKSETCDQCLKSEVESLFASNNIDIGSMPERRSNDFSSFGSFRVFPSGNPIQEQSLDHQDSQQPPQDEDDRKAIVSNRNSGHLKASSASSCRPPATDIHRESHDDNANKRPRLDRKYSSLIDTVSIKPPTLRKRVEPATRIRKHTPQNSVARLSDPTISTAPRPTQSLDSCHAPKTATTRPLQPILRPSDAHSRKAKRPNRRVSFSAENQIVVFDQGDETPIKEARNEWKIDHLPTRTEWENKMADLSMGESSSYRSDKYMDRYPRNDRRGRDRHTSAASLGSTRILNPDSDSGLRRAKSPVPRREFPTHLPWEKPPMHKHRHVDVRCKHEILDPMPCSCEEPDKVYEGRFSDCRECALEDAREFREEERMRARNKENSGDDSESWWNKLTKKITF
ncbi:hypothetical protein TWF281_000141 [Arthrobotrys megalospora]